MLPKLTQGRHQTTLHLAQGVRTRRILVIGSHKKEKAVGKTNGNITAHQETTSGLAARFYK